MLEAEILSVGTELLMGQILNTNARYIAQKLAELGMNLYHQVTVGDNRERLKDAISAALSRTDVVILTGGLGPTGDDLTKETAAELMGKQLVYDEESRVAMEKRFADLHCTMTPNNWKQVMFPEGCIILKNPNGTAPGCIIEEGGKAIILLPGPPKEMEPMFDNEVMPYLAKKTHTMLYSKVLRIFGSGESAVEYALKELIESQTNPTIAPYAKASEVTLRVTARCRTEEEGEELVQPTVERIKEIVGDVVYSEDDEMLWEVAAKLLKRSGKTLAAAESCTGGMLSSYLVSVPGCSDYFKEGAVVYCNEAKMRRLGVKQETLDKYSAVSEETAREMAEGMRRTAGTDLAVATTGYAGPDGGTAEAPVGTVFVALSSAEGTVVKKLHRRTSRDQIRYSACLNAFDMIRRELMKK